MPARLFADAILVKASRTAGGAKGQGFGQWYRPYPARMPEQALRSGRRAGQAQNARGPRTLVVTPGNIPDVAGLMQCIGAVAASRELVADKGYDATFIREDMEKRGGAAMILTKCNRLIRLPADAAG